MAIVGTILLNGVSRYFADDFRQQMEEGFDPDAALYGYLSDAAVRGDGAAAMAVMLDAYSGHLGLDANRSAAILDENGTVLAVSDGREVTLTWEKQQNVPMNLEPAEGFGKYIANKNSKTLHTPFCSGLPKEANRIYYDSYEAAMADGCKPCTGCIG